MKFFSALIAKLTGGDTAPKTLDQARSTFNEAKAALDRFGAMFAAASLDLDDLLAKGDNALKDFVTALNQKATAAEQALEQAKSATAAAVQRQTELTAERDSLSSQLTAHRSLLESIGFQPTADAKPEDVQAAFKRHVSGAVTQQLAEIGQPARTLPAATTGDGDPTLAELQHKLATCTDAAEAGRLAARANKLRNAQWASASARN